MRFQAKTTKKSSQNFSVSKPTTNFGIDHEAEADLINPSPTFEVLCQIWPTENAIQILSRSYLCLSRMFLSILKKNILSPLDGNCADLRVSESYFVCDCFAFSVVYNLQTLLLFHWHFKSFRNPWNFLKVKKMKKSKQNFQFCWIHLNVSMSGD